MTTYQTLLGSAWRRLHERGKCLTAGGCPEAHKGGHHPEGRKARELLGEVGGDQRRNLGF